jgi:hypothetical protein
MVGNLWEWVSDWYAPDYYLKPPENNPQGPPSGSGRVVRGGSYTDSEGDLRVAIRGGTPPNQSWNDQGFRCAQSITIVQDLGNPSGSAEIQATTPPPSSTQLPDGYAIVPDVVGLPLADAETILRDAGFSVSRDAEYNKDLEHGTVIHQNPEANTSMNVDEEVKVFFSIPYITIFSKSGTIGELIERVSVLLEEGYDYSIYISVASDNIDEANSVRVHIGIWGRGTIISSLSVASFSPYIISVQETNSYTFNLQATEGKNIDYSINITYTP